MKLNSFKNLVLILLFTNLMIVFSSLLKSEAKCNRFDITCNPHIKTITKPLAENTWGEAGSVGYQAATKIMSGRNGRGQGLDAVQKRYLQPHFGNLVDRVTIVYGARMMSEWCGIGKCVNMGKVHSAAQTYCNKIYVGESYKPNNISQIRLLAHELVHARQCEQLGGTGKFGYHYFKEFKKAGQNYENNALEREARDFAVQTRI